MKTQTINIDSFATLQQIIEDYNLSEWSSISQFIAELLNENKNQGYETVYIVINQAVLPPSYFQYGALFKKYIADKVEYPYLTHHRKYRGTKLYITASIHKEKQTAIFKQRLIQGIKEHGQITINKTDIPQSYRDQPYVILSRINKELNSKIKIKLNSAKSITYVNIQPQSKAQLPTT